MSDDSLNPETPGTEPEPRPEAPGAAPNSGLDLQATLKWVTAVLKDPSGAADAYRDLRAPWQQSLLQITLPVYVGAFVVGIVLSWITGGSFLYANLGVIAFLFSLVWALAWTFVIAFIFDYLAGVFDGERSFDAAYATVALAIIPSAMASSVSPLPWIGWLISIAGGIYGLVLAYQFLPVFLTIPEASRVKHFVVSIVAAIVVNILVTGAIGSLFAPAVLSGLGDLSDYDEDSASAVAGDTAAPGIFSGLERQAGIAEAAAADKYDAPSDGKLSEDQLEAYVDVLKKTQELSERLSGRLEKIDEKDPSISDVFGGISGAMRLGTAEMEVVKTRGDNWAEHQWVRSQIETARIQQDLNATTRHNYELFLQYKEQIEQYE